MVDFPSTLWNLSFEFISVGLASANRMPVKSNLWLLLHLSDYFMGLLISVHACVYTFTFVYHVQWSLHFFPPAQSHLLPHSLCP